MRVQWVAVTGAGVTRFGGSATVQHQAMHTNAEHAIARSTGGSSGFQVCQRPPPSHCQGWQRARHPGRPSRAAPACWQQAGKRCCDRCCTGVGHAAGTASSHDTQLFTLQWPSNASSAHPVVLDKVFEVDRRRLPHLHWHRLERDQLGTGGSRRSGAAPVGYR